MADARPVVIELPTRRATVQLARALAPALEVGDLLVLSGELGAGKTFFVRALARALGVPASVPVTSPTFALVHELSGRLPIVHADLYRLAEREEADQLGLFERRDDALLLVEWGGPHVDSLGGDAVHLALTLEGAHGRRASLSADPGGRACLSRLTRVLRGT